MFQNVYSQLLFRKEVVLSVLYLASLRTMHVQAMLPNDKPRRPALTKQLCEDKSNQQEWGTPG